MKIENLKTRGYDDDGNVVGCTWPSEPQDAEESPNDTREAVGWFLDWLIEGHLVDEVGRRALLLAFVWRRLNAGSTQRELAARMGLSVARVNTILRDFKGELTQNPPHW